MNFPKLGTLTLAACLSLGANAFAQDSAKQDMKDAGHETKMAAKDTGHATKRASKKAWHKTKRGAHKTKAAVENTGDRMKGEPPQHQ